MPRVTADPFDVQLVEQDFVADVLEPLSKLPVKYDEQQPSRWYNVGDGWMIVDHLQRVGGSAPRWEGAVQRTFEHEHPHRSGPTAGTRPLDLPDDEGLGEHVGFLYDETEKLLWLQRDRRVVGKMLFGDYLRVLTGVSFSMVVRLRADSVKRARKLKHIRKVEFAYLTSETAGARGPLEKLLDRLSGYGAARIEVKLSPVRGGTLDPSARELVETMSDEVDEDSDKVSKAHVTGRIDEDGEDMFIDLLRDRQHFSTSIPEGRTRDPQRLIGAVRRIWSDNRAKV